MLVVGLTGGIATGKSTVSNLLRSKRVPVVDSDILARQVVMPGTPVLTRIVHKFGSAILLPDGSLDRKKLGSIIFKDELQRRKLNSITHPAIRRAMLWAVFSQWIKGEKVCVIDAPLLIEAGLWKWVGKIIVVYCPAEIQLQRLMQRDNSSLHEASSRLNSQLPITEKVAYADHVIDNSGSLEGLEAQVNSLVQRLEREAGSMWRLCWLIPPLGLLSAIWTLALRAYWRSRRSVQLEKDDKH